MADGFLGRWSRRKLEAKEGRPLEEPAQEPLPQPSPQPSPASGRGSESGLGTVPPAPRDEMSPPSPGGISPSPRGGISPSPPGGEGRGEGPAAPDLQQPPEPPPTLADVVDLTPASDFRRFVARGVTPEVKNAALKKLFADPHFNVMDRLDVYIDDYSQPDPIPESMLRQLASAKFLGLFREEAGEEGREGETAPGLGATTEQSGAQSVAKSDMPGDVTAAPDSDPDAHPDLRLQQDDAAEGGEPGHGAG